MGVFAEFERAIDRRAASRPGFRGRGPRASVSAAPRIGPVDKEAAIRHSLTTGIGILAVARAERVGTSVVQRIKASMVA